MVIGYIDREWSFQTPRLPSGMNHKSYILTVNIYTTALSLFVSKEIRFFIYICLQALEFFPGIFSYSKKAMQVRGDVVPSGLETIITCWMSKIKRV